MKDLLFTAFFQGRDEESLGAGNCASVAVIKAAMYTYGFDVFTLNRNSHKYDIRLQNGEQVAFTKAELDYAKRESSFILGESKSAAEQSEYKKIIEYAHLCFATICKMAQLNGDYSSRFSKFIIPDSFEMAVEIINDGTFTPNVYEFLGLEDSVTPAYRLRLTKKIQESYGMVLWTGSHAMFAAEGYFDLYGKKEEFKNRVMLKLPGKIATGVFQIKP
ncbi:hypothetical protein C900_05178 [Fulvivirga imtechensis AK7]|uniref:Uncharacterized protein n=1 Tax=Fulvivirga imtechensis AK7 TaxID=1237149 RepID=L8JP73_9BACT|nr:hypothetical protein [Fulvivirga imtechensis]ELR69294.1 hypothetical protein C900_05178 [Fulvivirga imtechensis AK7]